MKRVACLIGPSILALALVGGLPARPAIARESNLPSAHVPVADTIAEARKQVAAIYIIPETGAALDKALAAAQSKGGFDGLSGEVLANRINEVMRTVTKDGHLSVRYDPRAAAEFSAQPDGRDEGDDAELPASYVREIAQANGGVAKLEVLPGNVRYMDYRGFMWGTPAASDALANAAQFLRGGDAVVIDLRRNGGGSAAAVRALASYFLPPQTKLMRFEQRGRPDDVSQTDPVPFTLADRPVYVLTSQGSFSAAEEFAAHVSAFKFGTLVGETTGGGGFNNTFVPLPGGFVMSISFGRAVHMVTGKDWEQVGIAPAIAVPADQALNRAQAEAMTALAARAPAEEREGYKRLAAYYRALLTPAEPGHALADYAGQYGARTLAVDTSGALTVARAGRPATRLVAVGPDLFVPETAPTQHFRFLPAGAGIEALEVDGPDGEPARFARSAS
jgi:hypothetical protein